jgi:hypothetical protein
MNSFRKSPIVCLSIALAKLAVGKLKMHKNQIGKKTPMHKGEEYTVFRQISVSKFNAPNNTSAFGVQFKFKHLSHKANKITSIVPMLMIAGFPGFVEKIYSADLKTGYWQGSYQWQTTDHMEAYKNSFVFRVMNKRAIKKSIKYNSGLHLNNTL